MHNTEFIPEPCLVFFPHLDLYDIIGKQSLGLYRMKTTTNFVAGFQFHDVVAPVRTVRV